MSGETMRQGGHASPIRQGQRISSEPSVQNGIVRNRPGILIFSRRQKLLHLNRRAWELIGHLNQPEAEMGLACEIHPAAVRELRNAIQAALDHRRDANIWGLFELKRVLVEAGRRILVRGFGLADRNSHDDSRIVIVLEELGVRQACGEPQREVMGAFQEVGGAAGWGAA